MSERVGFLVANEIVKGAVGEDAMTLLQVEAVAMLRETLEKGVSGRLEPVVRAYDILRGLHSVESRCVSEDDVAELRRLSVELTKRQLSRSEQWSRFYTALLTLSCTHPSLAAEQADLALAEYESRFGAVP
jgi:hypothetical protein